MNTVRRGVLRFILRFWILVFGMSIRAHEKGPIDECIKWYWIKQYDDIVNLPLRHCSFLQILKRQRYEKDCIWFPPVKKDTRKSQFLIRGLTYDKFMHLRFGRDNIPQSSTFKSLDCSSFGLLLRSLVDNIKVRLSNGDFMEKDDKALDAITRAK